MEDEGGALGPLRELFASLSPARRRQSLLVFALMLVGALAELGLIGAVIPFLSLLSGSGRGGDVASAAALLAAAAIAAGAVRLLLAWTSQRFAFGLGHDLSVEVQRRVLAQPYSWHVANRSAGALAALEKAQLLASGVALQAVQGAGAAVLGLFIAAALFLIDPLAAGVSAVALGLVYAAVAFAARRRLARHSAAIASAQEERIAAVQESLGAIVDVILGEAHSPHLTPFRRIDARLNRARAAAAFTATAPRFVVEAAGIALLAGAVLLLARRDGALPAALPVLGAFALAAQRLLPLVQQVYQSWVSLSANRAVARDILRLLRLPVEARGAPPAPLPLEREIRLEGVSLTYPGRSAPALAGVDLTISRGAWVAITGPTGSGKSTLAAVLMGLIDPEEGRVSVDGIELAAERRRAWRRSIAYVPQAIFLADGSIERNIAFAGEARDVDRARVAEAARRAAIDDFIASLPEGYATSVGERGVRLSGGQRQRLGLARALYKGAPLLVLDEATSALDAETEAAVLGSLRELSDRRGTTVIVIAHRESTLAACDLVVRLENGRVAPPSASLLPRRTGRGEAAGDG